MNNYKIYLPRGREVILSDKEYGMIEDLILGNKSRMVKLGGEVFNTKNVSSVVPYDDPAQQLATNSKRREQIHIDFERELDEYKSETAIQKAEREYYTRFAGILINAFGIYTVLGTDYISPSNMTIDGSWKFTSEQEAERKKRFNEWVENKSNHSDLWGVEAKKFFVKYFTDNPTKAWCPYSVWWELFIKDLVPHTNFEKVIIKQDMAIGNR